MGGMNGFYYMMGNLLFPKRCAYCGRVVGFAPECTACKQALADARISTSGELKYRIDCRSLDGLTACYRYQYPAKNGILRLKFHGARANAAPYGREIAQCVQRDFSKVTFDLLLPVPATARQKRRRGYNVPELLAQSAAGTLEIPTRNDILRKEYETRVQHELPRAARAVNVLGAYSVYNTAAVQHKTILLIDDIVTTGATLEECAKMLRIAGADAIYAATFAATPNTKADAVMPAAHS